MKDLYTFDSTEQQAKDTYDRVRAAYCAFLDELRLPYLVANADSGKMGGDLSHEYHFVSANGEDEVINCKSCGYAINEELYIAEHVDDGDGLAEKTVFGISSDRRQMIKIVVPEDADVNYFAVKRILPQLDTIVEDPVAMLEETGSVSDVVSLIDPRCHGPPTDSLDGKHIRLTKVRPGHSCPKCNSDLHIDRAVEIGHTFHLSTRYSEPLGAMIKNADGLQVPVQMGCHGIGVSRLIAAMADLLKDGNGLNWPLIVAPFQAVLIATNGVDDADTATLYDSLSLDSTIDDRQKTLGWKLNDADLIGYPFIIVLGRKWNAERIVELQCRRLGLKEEVAYDKLPLRLFELVKQLEDDGK